MGDAGWSLEPRLTDRDVARVIVGMRAGTAKVTILSPTDGGVKGEYTIRLTHEMIANGSTREYLVTRRQALQILEVDPECLSRFEEPRPTQSTTQDANAQNTTAQNTSARDANAQNATDQDAVEQDTTTHDATVRDVAKVETPATKACRYCGEQILAVAIKCKHCRSMLDEEPARRKAHPEWTGMPAPAPAPASDERGILLAIIPWVGVLVCWFWIGESPLVNASHNLMMLGLAVTLSTALVAAIDASALQLDRKHGGLGPIGTFIGVSLLWIVLYPVHMSNRGKAGVPSRLAPALVGALAFVALTVYFAVLINERLMELQRALNGL
jgi:hypothetical protein